jgi:hypothetical protein
VPEPTVLLKGPRLPRHRVRNQRRLGSAAVWFAQKPKILSNPRDAGAMTNEAFSRVLIDKELEFSGWNLLNPKEVRFELSGSNGRERKTVESWRLDTRTNRGKHWRLFGALCD